jgi:Histidine kinase-, DNA gyrase B-, and HSP90-like ATPase
MPLTEERPSPLTEGRIKASPRILDHLGLSAYNSLRKCLAELAANSYDADATEVRIAVPDVVDDSAVIDLTDDGMGMNAKDIDDNYLFIARDRRVEGQRSPGGRLLIGSKGIGKFAGFGIASRMQITTCKEGSQSLFTLDRGDFDDLVSIASKTIPITTSPTERGNGTKVRLCKLSAELQLPTTDVLRRHLFKVLPQKPDFRIYVNDIECTAEGIEGEKHAIAEKITAMGDITGFYIVAKHRQSNPGLAIRVRERVVTEPSLFGIDTHSHGFFTSERIVGEVNANFLDPEATSDGSKSLISTSRDRLLEDSQTVKAVEAWARDFLDKVIQGIDAAEQTRRTTYILNRPGLRERLERMPPHVRSTATKVVVAAIRKLRNTDDEEAAELIDWILRYYESNVLRELTRAIIAADVSDAQKLGQLVQDWGLKQVGSVVEIIKTQIEIIQKLEELTLSDKSKEIDLHKLIESNLWLVREGLELWSSDKPLKVLLEGQLEKVYKGRERIRPDVVCRSRDEGSRAVILEFKKPEETIKMEHVTQALEYEGLIHAHRPNIEFETYVIGRQYDAVVLAIRTKQEAAKL